MFRRTHSIRRGLHVSPASAGRLKVALEHHFEETTEQVERLKECFTLLGAQAKAKPCKGMAGLIEEGEEVLEEGKEKDGSFWKMM